MVRVSSEHAPGRHLPAKHRAAGEPGAGQGTGTLRRASPWPPWSGSWNGSPANLRVLGALMAVAYNVCADSADQARKHASRNALLFVSQAIAELGGSLDQGGASGAAGGPRPDSTLPRPLGPATRRRWRAQIKNAFRLDRISRGHLPPLPSSNSQTPRLGRPSDVASRWLRQPRHDANSQGFGAYEEEGRKAVDSWPKWELFSVELFRSAVEPFPNVLNRLRQQVKIAGWTMHVALIIHEI